MEHAFERGCFGLKPLDEALHVLGCADVGPDDAGVDTSFLQAGDEVGGFRGGSAAAAGEDEMTGSAVDEPFGEDAAESAESAGDEIGAVGFDVERWQRGFALM
jgi:hypothetical protein